MLHNVDVINLVMMNDDSHRFDSAKRLIMVIFLILLIFQVEDVLRLQPVGAGRAGPELVSRVGERVGEGHCAAALGLGRAVGERGLADERGDVAGLFAGVGAAAAAAQEEPLVAQLALPTQSALKKASSQLYWGHS